MKYVCERVEVSAKGVLRMRIVAATRLLNSVGTTTTHCQLALLALVVGVNDTILRAYVCKENVIAMEERGKKSSSNHTKIQIKNVI